LLHPICEVWLALPTTIDPHFALGVEHSPLRLELQPGGGSILGWEYLVSSAEIELGSNHVGLEERVANGGLDWPRALQIVEELCGPCSQANTLAYVQAAEEMAQLIVPPRATYLRLVLAEMERVVSHLMNAAGTMRALHMPEREAGLRDLRERALQAMAEWSGSRLHPGLITYGGLARNVDDLAHRGLTLAARHIERALRTQVNAIVKARDVASRLVGLGVITAEEAALAGLRGPVARASGITADIRSDFPTGAYEEEGATIVVQRAGDAFSRLVVRLLECLESLRLVEQALDDVPPGPVKARGSAEMRGGSGVGRVEGPRGEVFCWVRGGDEGLTGLHLSAGSFPTVNILPGLVRGNHIEDLNLLLLSVDLCLPCAER
jgi:ech hydrogenase subunit E